MVLKRVQKSSQAPQSQHKGFPHTAVISTRQTVETNFLHVSQPSRFHYNLSQVPVENAELPVLAPVQFTLGHETVLQKSSKGNLGAVSSDLMEEDDEEDDGFLPGDESSSDDEDERMEEDEEEEDKQSFSPPDPSSSFEKEFQKAQNLPILSSTLTPTPSDAKLVTQTSNLKFKNKTETLTRSKAYGNVTITLEVFEINGKEYQRPVNVSGLVEPTATTGRGGAPNPVGGFQIYFGQGKAPKESMEHDRNTGRPDVERGHIMALELGGPDISENIVPQWAKFQGSGDWRKMEVKVLELANATIAEGNFLKYTVDVFYKRYTGSLQPTFDAATFPTGFTASVQKIDNKGGEIGQPEVVFNQGQAQNITDDSLATRKLESMGDLQGLEYSDWDSASKKLRGADDESGSKKPKKPRSKAPRKVPGINQTVNPISKQKRKSKPKSQSSKGKKRN